MDRSREHPLAALRESVQHHLVADVPVGVFLSAGLDSATMMALAAGEHAPDLRSLTLGFREYLGTENDETQLAAATSSRYGARHETRWIERGDFESELDAILAAMDQPTIDGVNTYFVSRAAAASGMKVAMSGVGGDDLLGGYPSFRDVPRIRRFATALGAGAAPHQGRPHLQHLRLQHLRPPHAPQRWARDFQLHRQGRVHHHFRRRRAAPLVTWTTRALSLLARDAN
jgi:asparagine synthetase B (glutamine-hydrolysing)